MIGRTLSQYRILEKLGQGGMGEIYLAHDERLDRKVAIKAIAPDLVNDDSSRRRFLREARATAGLNHPFICTVHEVLEQEGQPFIVMEYIQGETILARLARGRLTSEELCRIGLEVAEALAAAHAVGIIHRDIKPSNIMMTRSGHVKVMDFGIARVESPLATRALEDSPTLSQALTQAGVTLGTITYMAPEQLRGKPADSRSDLYSFGVVLYEMATARPPFPERITSVLISDILNRVPPSPSTFNSEIPWSLEQLILSLLEKNPEARPASAEAVSREFRLLLAASDRPPTLEKKESIAVLPFRNLMNDPQNAHLGIGLADATITELALVRSLLVRPTSSIFRYQDRTVDPLQAGRELSVDAVVDGSFQCSGPRLRVTVQLISVATGRPLWSTKIHSTIDDIFELQDEVARKITQALQLELSDADESRLAQSKRSAGQAYDLFLKGKVLLLQETTTSVNKAIEYFEQAKQDDPGFALAYAGLSDAYGRIAFSWDPEGDWYALAEQMCQKALALDPNLPEGRYLKGRLLWSPHGGFDHAGAMRELMLAVSARPNLNEAHDWLGILLFHVGMLEESASAFKRALAIDPEDSTALMHFGFCRYLQGQYREALKISEDSAKRSLTSWASYQMALCHLHLGALEDAAKTTDLAARHFPGDVLIYPLRGLIAALKGDAARAREQIELTVKNRKSYGHYHHAQYDAACIYALLGQKETAHFQWLRDAAKNGFPCCPFFELDPFLENFRPDPRFRLLINELRTECAAYRQLYSTLGS